MSTNAIILGQYAGEYLRYTGPAHVCLAGSNRSGKGVSVIVPTLLSIGGSVVCLDVKTQNWPITAGWRQTMSHVCRFDPTGTTGIAIDPLLETRKGQHEVRDVQQLVDILAEGGNDPRSQDPPHWRDTAKSLLVGVGLHLLYAAPVADKSPGGMMRFLTHPGRNRLAMLHLLRNTYHLRTLPHPVVASIAQEMLNREEREQSGIVSTATRFLGLWRDPLVDQATSRSELVLRDLQYAPHPVSLYLCAPPSDLRRLKPLLCLLWQLLLRTLTETLPPATAHPLTLVMDEFPAMEQMAFFESTLPYLADYKIRVLLVVQSLNQLDHWYGQDSSLLDNCEVKVIYRPGNERVADRLVKWLGTATVTQDHLTYSGNRGSLVLNRVSRSTQETGRPLLMADELQRLPSTDALIFAEDAPPIRAQKIRYFQDPTFRTRLVAPPPDGARDLPPQRFNPWLQEGPKPVRTKEARG